MSDDATAVIDELLEQSGNKTVDEVLDGLDRDTAYEVFYGGNGPELYRSTQAIHIDQAAVERAGDLNEGSEFAWKNHSGIGYLWAPLDLAIRDIPYSIGKTSARLGDRGEEEYRLDSLAAKWGWRSTVGAMAYDLFTEAGGAEGIPDNPFMYFVLAGLPASYAVKGRAKGVQENIRERKLERLSSERGEYTVEVKNMLLEDPGALTADDLEGYEWD